MKRAFVTGAGGFIGSALVRRLDAAGWSVDAVARTDEGARRLAGHSERVRIRALDVADRDAMIAAVRECAPDHVFHLAAQLAASGVAAPLESLLRSNVLGVANMVEAIERTPVASALFTGTCLEYGPKPDSIKETERCDPLEPYGLTKLAGSILAQAAGRTRGLPTIVFRLFSPFGPGSQAGRVVTETIRRSLRNEPVSLSDPNISRDFIFIDDVLDLFLEAAEQPHFPAGEIYNVGSGRAVSLKELSDLVLSETGSKSPVTWGSARRAAYDAEIWQADMQKTHAAFSWRPKHTFLEGIRETIAAYRESQES